MQNPLDPAAKKAYELAYGISRVAALAPSQALADFLEREALGILRGTVRNLFTDAFEALKSARYLISFGRDTGKIHPENANLLVQQIEVLESLLVERDRTVMPAADLGDVFSETPVSQSETAAATSSMRKVASAPKHNAAPASLPPPSRAMGSSLAFRDRQAILIEKIRQSGNCRTRDLQAVLPDLSERTLRYDLQRLVEEGKLERGGGGGPASWYRIKQATSQSNVFGASAL